MEHERVNRVEKLKVRPLNSNNHFLRKAISMKRNKVLKISWNKYLKLVESLYNMIKKGKRKYSKVVAINRGGNIIGTILSHKLGIPLQVVNCASDINVGMYQGDLKGVILVVDDVVDTGKTLLNIDYPWLNYEFGSLHVKSHCKHKPTFYVEKIESDVWIRYPYEIE